MRRTVSVCVALVVLGLLAGLVFDASAQSIKIKRVGISVNYAKIAYPGQTWSWQISNGLKAVGTGTRAFWVADTVGSNATGAPSWAIVSVPGGSTATLDSTGTMANSMKTDVVGQYIVSVTIGGLTAYDSIWASNYRGMTADANAGCVCHPTAGDIKAKWATTGHAKIFTEGITGELEVVEETGQGLYAKSCISCHTTGFQYELDNGNFGYLAHNNPAPPNAWDSTWWAGLPITADGRDVMITSGDQTILNALPSILKPVSYIGCESCHGPLDQHMSTFDMTMQRVGKTLEPDVCNQCHDGSTRHSLGSWARNSLHGMLPEGGHTNRSGCYPCHSGGAFVEWVKAGKDTTGFAAAGKWTAASGNIPIACATCHEPHGMDDPANPWNLRTTSVDSLLCGYQPTSGGYGLLCMNCHKARYDVRVRVQPNNPPYFGFVVDRYGPHESPQADMFFGVGGYQYEDESFTGVNTHGSLENGCTTCHMGERGSALLPNHEMSMDEAEYAGTGFDPLEACAGCHGTISSYDDIKAFYDFDDNGSIDGVQTEIQGLLTKLKAVLPQDPSTGEPVTMRKDSLLVKNRADYVEGIWNYYLVLNDGSMGIHNAQYAAALLRKSLGLNLADVRLLDPKVPEAFVLNQNYPNPFNPTTNITFALPSQEQVKIEIYNVAGERVKVLVDQTFSAGTFQLTWDGTSETGMKTPSGMFIYRIQAGSFVSAKKMLMLK